MKPHQKIWTIDSDGKPRNLTKKEIKLIDAEEELARLTVALKLPKRCLNMKYIKERIRYVLKVLS